MLVAWGLAFVFKSSWVQVWRCYVCRFSTNRNRVQRWLTHQNILALKFFIFSPNYKISFIDIVLVWTCRTDSDRCCFPQNMILIQPRSSICQPSYYGSWSSKNTEFIWCVDGQECKIHKLWCLCLDNITQEVHPTSRVEVVAGTVGEFTNN